MVKYCFAFTGLTLCLFYALTLCPTVPGGDSGELITVAYSLGVAHPPGYPLYTLIAHVFSYLPWGSVAFRINLLSAVLSVAAGLLMFHLIWKWLKDEWAACIVALFFFLSPLVWRYAVVAEVFSLNNFFALLLLTGFYKFLETHSRKWLWVLGATLGLACSHHHTILFLAGPLFFWLCCFHPKEIFKVKSFVPALALFCVGFLPYLYIPWAAEKQFIFSWGDASHWQGFWTHFFRQEYGTFQLASGEDESKFWVSLLKYSEDLVRQTLVLALLPVVAGLAYYFKNRKSERSHTKEFLGALGISYLFYIIAFHYLANMDLSNRLFFDIQSRFWMLPNLLLCFFMAYGVSEVRKYKRLRFLPFVFMLVYFPLQIAISYEHEDYSRNTIFEDVGRSTLTSLPPNSIMLMRGDIYVNSVRYLQEVEGLRTDVKAIPLDLMWWPWSKALIEKNYPGVVVPAQVYRYQRDAWDSFSLLEFFAANAAKFPIFIGKLRSDELKVIEGKYSLWNLGYINAVTPRGQGIDFDTYKAWAKAFDQYIPPTKSDIRDRSWEAFVYYNYWDREIRRLQEIFIQASEQGFPLAYLEYGAERLELVRARHHDPPAHVYKNLGLAYQFLAQRKPLYARRMIEVWQSYVEMSESRSDPDYQKILTLLNSQVARAALAPLRIPLAAPQEQSAQVQPEAGSKSSGGASKTQLRRGTASQEDASK